MTNEQTTLLISVLASTDATWLPTRAPRSNSWLNVFAARHAFRGGMGGPWRPLTGGNEQLRKQRQRALEQMSADGLLDLARRRESRLVGATLTPSGEAMARALCGLPGWEAALASEDELRRLADSEFAACEGNWISERGLAGCDYRDMDSAELVLVENLMLPSLVAGRVESLADSAGRNWFRLTSAGGPDGLPEPTGIAPCDSLRVLYESELTRHLDQFSVARPKWPNEIQAVPLPCSLRTKGGVS